jgi:hypothetical protein
MKEIASSSIGVSAKYRNFKSWLGFYIKTIIFNMNDVM